MLNLMNNKKIIDYICIVAIRDSQIQIDDILARPCHIYLPRYAFCYGCRDIFV